MSNYLYSVDELKVKMLETMLTDDSENVKAFCKALVAKLEEDADENAG